MTGAVDCGLPGCAKFVIPDLIRYPEFYCNIFLDSPPEFIPQLLRDQNDDKGDEMMAVAAS